jgi:flagellum-specific peptidoglycan hydrolase FlgJ
MNTYPPGSVVEFNYEPKKRFNLWNFLSIVSPAALLIWMLSATTPEPKEAAQMSIVPTDLIDLPETGVRKAKLPAHTEPKARAYILRFQVTCLQEYKKFGVLPSVKLAQGILESKFGTSELTAASNNHFGIKCAVKGCKHQTCINACDDSCRDYFVSYESAWRSYREHSKLISNPNFRYASLIKSCGTDYKCWTKGLQKKGYATSKQYERKLNAIIQRYELYRLDDGLLFE